MDHEFVLEWLRFAERNLAIAEHLAATFHPLPLEDVCFNCQQSAEKYLKGYLTSVSDNMPPRTHDLIELCALCAAHDPYFDSLAVVCSALNPYSVQPRYPQEIYVDEALTQKALRHAAEIKAFPPLLKLRERMEQE